MNDDNPEPVYKYLLEKCSKIDVAFVEIKEAGTSDKIPQGQEDKGRKAMPNCLASLSKYFKGIIFSNEGITPESGAKLISS